MSASRRDAHAGTVHAAVRTAGDGRLGLSWAGTRNQRIGPHSRSPRALRPRLATLVQYELTKQISMSRLIDIHPENPQPRLIRQVADCLSAGGLVAYPTDTSYALGCHIGDKDAMERIRRLRQLDDKHI